MRRHGAAAQHLGEDRRVLGVVDAVAELVDEDLEQRRLFGTVGSGEVARHRRRLGEPVERELHEVGVGGHLGAPGRGDGVQRRLALFGLVGHVLEVRVEDVDRAVPADVHLVGETVEGEPLQVRDGGLAQMAEPGAVELLEVAAEFGQPLFGQQHRLGLIERAEQPVRGQRPVRDPVAGGQRAAEVDLTERLRREHPPVRVGTVQHVTVAAEQRISREREGPLGKGLGNGSQRYRDMPNCHLSTVQQV